MGGKLRIIVVAGLPGVGKSTVLSRTRELLSKEGLETEVLNFGDFMLKVLKDKGIVESRDEMRKLPLEKQREAQRLVAIEIRKYFEEKAKTLGATAFIGFVDTHVIVKTSSGLWPGLPKYVVEELNPDSIVLVEASPKEIVARQLRDRARYRADYADEGLVKELLELMRIFAIASATLVGASVNFIENKEGRVEEAAVRLAEVIRRL